MISEASGRASSGANPEISEFGDPLIACLNIACLNIACLNIACLNIACLNIVGPNWPLDLIQRLRPAPSYIRSF
jgi:hypothetical protein